jgi:phosphoenolpyruvate synthase/pyruvate phosphate dikinase/1-acyl-sn-glycerol-3-phosphate acyltransferase
VKLLEPKLGPKSLETTRRTTTAGAGAKVLPRQIAKVLSGKAPVSNAEVLATKLFPRLGPTNQKALAGQGLVEGTAHGRIVRTREQAEQLQGKSYVLAAESLGPDDLPLALAASGLLIRDAKLAVVARRLGKPVVYLSDADFQGLASGSTVTMDGGPKARVVLGEAEILPGGGEKRLGIAVESLKENFKSTIIGEASTTAGIKKALTLGADSLRIDVDTILESPSILPNVRRYLLSDSPRVRRDALELVSVSVTEAAMGLMTAAGTKRTVFAIGARQPHQFFPAQNLGAVAEALQLPVKLVEERVSELGGGNSKLGLKGARWAVKDADLLGAISRGLFEAQAARQASSGVKGAGPSSLLLTSVVLEGEMRLAKERMELERLDVERDFGVALDVSYSAGIDTPRGALSAGGISKHVEALEYSIPGLTETTFGLSADDAARFLPRSVAEGVLPADPFQKTDQLGVGELVRVGQFLAGDAPNQFPASLYGTQLGNVELGAQAGISSFVVPVDQVFSARVEHAKAVTDAARSAGQTPKQTRSRDQSAKVFEILIRPPMREGEVRPPVSIPEGSTPLEFAEGLVAQVESGALTSAEALMQMPSDLVDSLGRPTVDPKAQVRVLSPGIGGSPGSGQGRIALSPEAAAEFEKQGQPYVLVVNEVHAEDVPAVRKAQGLISVRGGKTSHSAMIASNSDVPCVLSEKVRINLETLSVGIGNAVLKEGDWVTIEGTKGQIIEGKAPLLNPAEGKAFGRIMSWADEHRSLRVLANADTPEEATLAFKKGAEGVGLVRSEHMFYEPDRLALLRTVILSEADSRPVEIEQLERIQAQSYADLFQAAEGKAVSVRLLDPPLYEFLPTEPAEIRALAKTMGLPPDVLVKRINALQEVDSMLGMRGVRLGLMRPDIESMQVRALATAYAQAFVQAERDGSLTPAPLQVVVPQLSAGGEMKAARERILKVVAEVAAEFGMPIPVKLGAMIETPRGALDAAEIAKHANFFSYGTNDLTQTTLGYGRNVAQKFVPNLISAGVLSSDPTGVLDRGGVGKLIEVANFLGCDGAGQFSSGVCGGQGADPDSLRTIQALGLTYVSVPPAQITKAKLGAAQAAIAARSVDGTSPSAQEVTERIRRTQSGLGPLPILPQHRHLRVQLELQLRRASALIDEGRVGLEGNAHPAQRPEVKELMKAAFSAQTALNHSRLLGAVSSEIRALRASSATLPNAQAIAVHLEAAEADLAKLEEAANTLHDGGAASSAAQRDLAALGRTALRSVEEARRGISEIIPPIEHQERVALKYQNDVWDNQHYTRSAPKPNEPFGVYLKKVAKEFLVDNGMHVEVTGQSNIPVNRRVIFAVSHRSGAIDRFVTMSALPVDPDKFMYLVKEGSPADVIAKAAYGENNKWIVPARKFDETAARVRAGFEAGATSLVMYPEGTAPLIGEPRHVAKSTAVMAVQSDAVIVPVILDDSHRVSPFEGGTIAVRIEPPLDPRAMQTMTEAETIDTLHTALQYELSRHYRT